MKPRRTVAVLFALFGPWGIGQFYLGRTRRALAWFLLPAMLVVACALALPHLGADGYGLGVGAAVAISFVAWLGSFVDLWRIPDDHVVHRRGWQVFAYWVVGLMLAVSLRLWVREAAIEAYRIPGGSMQPTLMSHDHVLVDKHTFSPRRGQLVVLRDLEHPDREFAKRVMALPGDELVVRGGHPFLNGWEVPHCLVGRTAMPPSEDDESPREGNLEVEFLEDATYLVFFDDVGASFEEMQGPYRVGAGESWVLGDNRHNSYDSRMWNAGSGAGVPADHLRGRILYRYFGADGAVRIGAVERVMLPPTARALQPALDLCLAARPGNTTPPAR